MTIKHPGFYVWNPINGRARYRHETLKSASDEAKRLAGEHAGQQFFVMAPVAVAASEQSPVKFGLVEPGQADPFDLDELIPF